MLKMSSRCVDFDWKAHHNTLDDIFFSDEDVIKRENTIVACFDKDMLALQSSDGETQDRRSPQYKDFWLFLERYQKYQRRKPANEKSAQGTKRKEKSVLELPDNYDKRYKVNISLKSKDAKSLKRLLRGRVDVSGTQRDESNSLSVNDLLEFKTIILYYLDFCQKQKFAKLQKLRSDQENLPISQFKDVIVEHVKTNQVVIVAGDTGCGKSTQIPQYLLSGGFSCIACTQPRRIACISLAKRVSYETLNEYGSDVAYQIRFETSKTRHTKILFLTEGLLLRQLSSDPSLSQYNIIVMDEVHERHIHGDFLLGVLKGLVHERKDLKLLLMSATINIKLFATYFSGAPVIQVPGRLYPIEVRFIPPSTEATVVQSRGAERLDPRPYLRILQLIDNKYPASERGDLLIFLSGMSEIAAVVDAAEEYAQQTQRWIVLPLHSALSIDEQDKVFDVAPDGVRKCIVSTNIAETSVTIDGVRFIVDSGKVKEMSYDSQVKLQKLQEFWISQASAEQRKGRAGRTGPGVCFRLYAESDYDAFSQYSTPEIHRAPLDTIVLQMISLGIPDVRHFPFIEPPPQSSIENSLHVLTQQGALSTGEEITPIGEMLAKLPVDVVIGKMLIMASVFHMIDPVLTIAAAMSVQSPFTRRFTNDPDVMNARQLLESEHGDPFTLLNAFDEWLHAKGKGPSSRKWCRRRGLEEQRFYEMIKLKEQFEQLLYDHGLVERKSSNSRERKQENQHKLRKLKREHLKGPRRPKMLKLGQQGTESDDEGQEVDLRDMEFKLVHDLDKLQRGSTLRRSFTLRDLNLLKIILCCGLYPQLTIPDEHNPSKNVTEHVFHTNTKQFLMLHPTCVFVSQPELMYPNQDQKPSCSRRDVEGSRSASDGSRRASDGSRRSSEGCRSNHEMMSYVSLLETRKAYIMNVMRVPALQTLLLFGSTVDSNADCTRLVVDDWIELGIPDAAVAQQTVASVIHLRTTWDTMLKRRIERKREDDEDIEYFAYVLSSKLAEFLDCNVSYTIKRLLQADVDHLYVGNDNYGGSLNVPVLGNTKGIKVHPTKGGVIVNHYFTYNDLLSQTEAEASSNAAQYIQKHWTCGICGTKMVVTVLERIEHEKQCSAPSTSKSSEIGKPVEEKKKKKEDGESSLARLRKTFVCPECKQEFSFTATEILRHKRSHK